MRLRTSFKSIGKSFPSKARHIFLRRKIAQCTKQVPDSPCNVMYFFTCISSEKSHVFDAALRRVVIFSTKAHYMLVYMIWHMPRPPACFWSTNPRNNVLRIDMFWAKAKTAIIGHRSLPLRLLFSACLIFSGGLWVSQVTTTLL